MSPCDDKALSGEDRLIAKYFRPLAKHPGALSLNDDAAVLAPPPGHDLVITKDALVACVHFFANDPPGDIARKALRVNLSDLAAKGATPIGFLLAIALSDTKEEWVAAFAKGLGGDADAYNCPLLGGDTVTTPGPLTISVTALGSVPKDKMVRRDGAKVGDIVLVTGTIGDAALGLALRRGAKWKLGNVQREHLENRYLLPQPRNALAAALRDNASAAMDVSDGLAGDFDKLCRTSHVRAEIEAARVPLSAAAQAALKSDPKLIETILTGGDDYEIVCTVPPGKLAAVHAAAKVAQVAVSEIGTVAAGEGARFTGADGKPLTFARLSYSHL